MTKKTTDDLKAQEDQADKDGEAIISKDLQATAEAAARHADWVAKKLATPGVEQHDPRLCVWELLAEDEKAKWCEAGYAPA
jgi:hypothetical protein